MEIQHNRRDKIAFVRVCGAGRRIGIIHWAMTKKTKPIYPTSQNQTPVSSFEFTVSKEKGAVVIDARGSVNSRYSPMLRDAINQAYDEDCKHVIVNVDRVEYMDSSGLATLVEGMQLAEQNQGKFVLAGTIHEKVVHLFEITRLDGLFENYPTVQDALLAIK